MTDLKTVIDSTPELTALGSNYPAISAWLAYTPQVPNPQSQTQTPRRIAMLDVFTAVAGAAPADLAKAGTIPSWMIDRAEGAMASNDRTALGNWLVTIGATAALSQAATVALAALLAQTEPDPTWQATVPGTPRWQAAGLASAPTAADVQQALNGA